MSHIGVIEYSMKTLFIAIYSSIFLITMLFSLVFKVESPIKTQQDNRNNLLPNIIELVTGVIFILYIISRFKDNWTINILVIMPFILSAIFFSDGLNFYIHEKKRKKLK
ncbi:TPA: hypothetical protein ACG3P3_001630 [Clostridioides difficile]